MNPKELRIGNLILDDEGFAVKISGVSPLDHLNRCDTEEGCWVLFDILPVNDKGNKGWEVESKNTKPIPLTDEWLTKLWFWPEKDNHRVSPCCDYALVKKKDGYYIYNHSEVDGSLTWIRTNAIQYVHQLQNLYFALTGEELAIDVNSLDTNPYK